MTIRYASQHSILVLGLVLGTLMIHGCSGTSDRSTTIGVMGGTASPQTTSSTSIPQDSGNYVTPDPTKGSVSGILVLENDRGTVPVANAILYLAETLSDDSGEDSLAAFDRVRSPRTVTDDQGRFTFMNIQPSTYGLVLDTVVNSYLLLWPREQEAILIEISGGEGVELGTLTYDSLPLPAP
ncbi:MAG: hypothetical protein ACC700_12295 [Anaerolineales bacterium]